METHKSPRVIRLIKPENVVVELDSSDPEEEAPCRLCTKSFSNATALRNHVRLQHTAEYETGADPDKWMEPATPSRSNTITLFKSEPSSEDDQQKKITEKKTADLMMSLRPQSLMTLASEDVSYIIIKTDPDEEATNGRKRKMKETKEKKEKKEDAPKRSYSRRDREPEPITGPFECLEPSSHLADTTCHRIFFSCCAYSIHHRDDHSKRRRVPRCQVRERPLGEGPDAVPVDRPVAPYACQVCGEGFQSNNDLQDHTSSAHVKLKPFQCQMCQKRFTQQGGLVQHMRMHSGDRPYPCSFCSKAFTQKSGRDQHLRTHTKVKPFRCVVCNKTFCQPVHLKQHMRTHTNVAPFECGLCKKRFKQSSHLNYHLKSHSEDEFTDEQRQKYANLLYIIQKHATAEKDGYVRVRDPIAEVAEHKPQQGIELDETEQSVISIENQICMDDDAEYILDDDGSQAWCVKLVEDSTC